MSLAEVTSRIRAAERAAGRSEGSVDLVAVSKVQPDDRVDAVLAEGHRRFGENRVQEALGRWTERRERVGDLTLHLIGPLQTNKAKQAVGFFDVIESVDRLKLAEKLADAMAALDRAPLLYVQVNTGEEAQKAGVPPAEVDGFLAALRDDIGLAVEGLMAIPPAHEPPAPHFALLRKLAERNGLTKLSMVMTADY
ncbi:MAG: YggS family pyridoxal phosphate-dependent enzyme [Pseudomonadota bacterium]